MSGATAGQHLPAPDRHAPTREVHPAIAEIARELGEEAGAAAVLFYGSNLRTGSLEGVLDFYVLLPGPHERGLWPRVSYREWPRDGLTLRAKIATMQLATFADAAAGLTLDTTIWARFVQPSALAWARGPEDADAVRRALEDAAGTAAVLAVAVGPSQGTEDDYWRALFRATYRAELRVEPVGREDAILGVNRAHFTGLLGQALAREGIAFEQRGEVIVPHLPERKRQRLLRWWGRRRRLGKPLNILRLLRATSTFDGAARYAAWKVERHTGIPVEITPWRERHPILAAPGILWRIGRARRRRAQLPER